MMFIHLKHIENGLNQFDIYQEAAIGKNSKLRICMHSIWQSMRSIKKNTVLVCCNAQKLKISRLKIRDTNSFHRKKQ